MVGREPRRRAGAARSSSVALIEAVPHDAAAQPSFDERTTALSNGSRRILETLGRVAGARARGDADPQNPCVGSGPLRLRAHRRRRAGPRGHGLCRAEPRARRGAVVAPARAARMSTCFCPARVSRRRGGERCGRSCEIAEAGGTALPSTAQLVVAADGAQSAVRERLRRRGARRATTGRPRSSPPCCRSASTIMWPTSASPPAGRWRCCRSTDGRCTLVLTLEPGGGAGGHGRGRTRSSSPKCSGASDFGWAASSRSGRRAPYPLSLDARRAHQRGALRHRRQCGTGPASGRRHGLQPGAARCRQPRRTHRRAPPRARLRSRRPRACWPPTMPGARRIARGVIAFTDGLVRMFANPLGVGAAAAQPRAPGLRPAAAGEGRAVASEHRRRPGASARSSRAAWRCDERSASARLRCRRRRRRRGRRRHGEPACWRAGCARAGGWRSSPISVRALRRRRTPTGTCGCLR